jgi:hypothetical protein
MTGEEKRCASPVKPLCSNLTEKRKLVWVWGGGRPSRSPCEGLMHLVLSAGSCTFDSCKNQDRHALPDPPIGGSAAMPSWWQTAGVGLSSYFYLLDYVFSCFFFFVFSFFSNFLFFFLCFFFLKEKTIALLICEIELFCKDRPVALSTDGWERRACLCLLEHLSSDHVASMTIYHTTQ